MRKELTTALALLLFILVSTPAFAQEGTIELGPGLVYGGQVEKLGLKLDGYYTINENIRAGVDLTYYFPETNSIGGTDVTSNFFTIDLLGNYIFYSEDEISAYGIAGLNLAFASAKAGGNKTSNNEMGLTLGGGAEYALDFGDIFGELRVAGLGGDADQLVLGAGVRLKIQ
jgi:opacity protein-like surface antigen